MTRHKTNAALTRRGQTDVLNAAASEATQKVEHTLIRLCLDDQTALGQALLGDVDSRDRFDRLSQAMRDHEREVASR